MEARSSGHLDACVEKRRDALLGAERGCALLGESPILGKSIDCDKKKTKSDKF